MSDLLMDDLLTIDDGLCAREEPLTPIPAAAIRRIIGSCTLGSCH